jgi:hypothetical protein
MDDEELSQWFKANENLLETAYLAGTYPWQQSSFGLHTPRSAQDWEVLRKPIAECLTTSGTLLDIGCANGYLLECIQAWTQGRNLQIIPIGNGLLVFAYYTRMNERKQCYRYFFVRHKGTTCEYYSYQFTFLMIEYA